MSFAEDLSWQRLEILYCHTKQEHSVLARLGYIFTVVVKDNISCLLLMICHLEVYDISFWEALCPEGIAYKRISMSPSPEQLLKFLGYTLIGSFYKLCTKGMRYITGKMDHVTCANLCKGS